MGGLDKIDRAYTIYRHMIFEVFEPLPSLKGQISMLILQLHSIGVSLLEGVRAVEGGVWTVEPLRLRGFDPPPPP